MAVFLARDIHFLYELIPIPCRQEVINPTAICGIKSSVGARVWVHVRGCACVHVWDLWVHVRVINFNNLNKKYT